LGYWALLGVLSVAGWSRQLARSRRYRTWTNDAGATPPTTTSSTAAAAAQGFEAPASTDASVNPSPDASAPSTPMGLTFGSLPALPNGAGMSQAATDFFDAADRRVPTLSLNARRKFFHALAVAMFLPGLAIDPAFTHLAFSAAFALFTFTEYVRYFALYPFGAAVHVFLSEFLDPKDAGAAILSHFYLLTGCANSVWLEAPSLLLQFSGILALGVGDALASIVGKRVGRHRWSATTAKSLEGSAAFVLSVVACAWVLRACGLTEPFSIIRFTVIAVLTAAVEAMSVQNDNLTIPLFMWSVLRVALV
jgi:dolichol kinase